MKTVNSVYDSMVEKGGLFSGLRKALSAARLGLIGFFTLILLWPLGQVDSLVYERNHRKAEAEKEIALHSGGENTLAGPFLTVPYKEWREWDEDKTKVRTFTRRYLHLMPAELKVVGSMKGELRRRGLFEIPVFTGDFSIEGNFASLDLEKLGIAEEDIFWQEAFIDMGLESPLGLAAPAYFTSGATKAEMRPANREGHPNVYPSLEVTSPLVMGSALPFRVDLKLKGSAKLSVIPVGERTSVKLSSDWPHPSFSGSQLPETRDVGQEGFTAQWQDMGFGHGFANSWRDSQITEKSLEASAFGVQFLYPIDTYAQVKRSTQYGMLFILMTFLVLYLAETMGTLRIHPLQYLLVGAGLCLFYLLLLSVSEHMGFDLAYALASLSIVGLISSYAWAIMRKPKPTLILGGMLTGLYCYLFVTLQAEDFALVLGSAGLFILLGLIMYATRSLGKQSEQVAGSEGSKLEGDPKGAIESLA
jgi:inner membrane protein